jgi:hypothetical protein
MFVTCLLAARASVFTVSPTSDLQGVASAMAPGDSLVLEDGLYELDGTLTISVPGEEAARIEVRAQNGATPILKAMGPFTVFELRDSSYATIAGLTFEGNDTWEEEGGNGVILRNTNQVTFEDNEIRNTRQSSINVAGDAVGLTLRHNHFHHSSDGHGLYAGCGDGSCWIADSLIERNLVHDLLSEGARYGIVLDNGSQGNQLLDNTLYAVYHGLRVESTQLGEPNVLEGNVVWEGRGNGIEVTGAARVRNNVVFQMDGVGIFSGNHENDDLADVVISYNTVALTDGWAVRLEDWANRDGMVFSSNAIANITGQGLLYESDEEDATNYVTRNVVSGLVTGIDPALFPDWYVPGSGVADFANVEAWDFYPVPTSGLVGEGDPAGEAWIPDVDFNGAPRNGANPTAGAYEWSGGNANPGWRIAEEFKEVDTVDGGGTTEIPKGGCCGKNEDSGQAWLLIPLLPLALRRRRR